MDTQTDHGRRADGPFLDFLPSQAYGVCNLRERIAPLRRLSGSLSALILREPTTIPCTPPHSFCVLSDCPSPSVSACWGARALAGCTQQALTKLKNVLPNDLGTEKVNSVSDKSSRSGALPL